VWLYYVDRQALVPRAHVLDGFEGAFDEDRVGWTPVDASLSVRERVPSRYREHHARLRLANVRFVLSFRPLPEDLVTLRGEARLPEVGEPLRLFELEDALPRAFVPAEVDVVADRQELRRRLAGADFDPRRRVLVEQPPGVETGPPEGDPRPEARYERVDPHTVKVEVPGPPGLLLVLDGYHIGWKAEVAGASRPVFRADGRYRAIPTRGGGEVLTLRFDPAWRGPALTAAAVGALASLVLLAVGRRIPQELPGERTGTPYCKG